ncbi:MAG: M81 family metallopeptidase [Lautropia sp.]
MSNQSRRARVALAGFQLESVSFLPLSCELADFERAALRGEAILTALRGTNTAPGGIIEVCEREGLEIFPVLQTSCGAAGPGTDEAIATLTREIVDAIAAERDRLDGVLLFLHGACWSPGYLDPERHVIDEVRRVLGPDKPLMVALDYHGNLDARTLAGADGAFGYRKSPHTDAGETGRRTADCMVRTLRGEIRPRIHLKKPGVLVPSIFSATDLKPLSDLIAEAARMQATSPAYVDFTIMAGFSYTDAPNTGFSVLATADHGHPEVAAQVQQLSDRIHGQRHALYRPLPVYTVDQALDRVRAIPPVPGRPLILLEHADRVNDSTYVLAGLLERGLRRATVPLLWDAEAARIAARAGAGQTVRMRLGAHSSDRAGPRLDVEATVLEVGERHFLNTGSYMQGLRVDLGLTALVEIAGIQVSITSESHTAVNGDPFYLFGRKPEDFEIIVLRSKTHFRHFYEPIASEILIVDTPDHGPADLTTLPFRHLDTGAAYPFTDS